MKTNRSMIRTALAACGLGMVAMTGAHAADTISVVTFGGAYEAAAKKAWFEPFTAKTGDQFSTESYDGGLAKLQAMEQAKNPTWDLIDLETNDAINACDEGLLEKFDKKTLGNTADFLPGSISDCAVSAMVWSTVYAYDTSKLKTAPTTIGDFFDLKKFPGKRGMRKSPKVAMEWALIADGVAPQDVYKTLATPAGVDRAFRKLDTIKSNIVWWDAGAQAPQLLADGAVVMTRRTTAASTTPFTRTRSRSRSCGTHRCTTMNGGACRPARSMAMRRASSSSRRPRRRPTPICRSTSPTRRPARTQFR